MTHRVLITGGCGFVGTNVLLALLQAGLDVRVLDDCSTGDPSVAAAHGVELMRGDIRDPERIAQAVAGCQSVVHLAANASVQDSIRDPCQSFDINARGTLIVLEQARRAGVERVIFASSNAAVGEHSPPIDETKAARPVSPYGASKLAGEGYCSAFHSTYQLATVSLRFANIYGPHSAHKRSVVTRFVTQLLNDQPVTVYGDGRQTRDFVYVADIVRAIVTCLSTQLNGEVLHVGSGRETSILECLAHAQAAVGRTAHVQWAPLPTGEVTRSWASIERAGRVLNFRPTWDLRAGLVETVRWFESRRDG